MNLEGQNPRPESDSAARVLRVQQLFVTGQGNLLAFILSLHPGMAEAEDILQETFLVVSRKADTFAEGTNFLAWACTIARFKVLEFRRRQNTVDVCICQLPESTHTVRIRVSV